MKAGKLAGAVENRSVLKQIGAVGLEPAGVTCLPLQDSGRVLVAVTDQTTLFGAQETQAFCIGALMNRVCGKLKTHAAEHTVYAFSLSVAEHTDENALKKIIGKIADEAKKREITGYTVHTRVRYEPAAAGGAAVLTLTGSGIGKAAVQTSQTMDGMGVVMAGYAALEATAVLIREKEELLRTRLAQGYLENGFFKAVQTDVCPMIEIARKEGAVVKTAGEGGIFTALWELGEYFDCGMRISLCEIPMLQETIEVCEVLDVNPYLLASGGCILAVVKDAEKLLGTYREAGIAAAVIGTLKSGRDRILCSGDEERFLEPFRSEELYQVLAGYMDVSCGKITRMC